MKNNRIVRAYDSINPSLTDKQRMLDQILQEANLEEKREKTTRKPAPRVHTARAKPYKKSNPIGLIAASLAVFLLAGILLTQVIRHPSDISATQPVAQATENTVQDHYAPIIAKYNQAIADGWSREQCEIEGISPRMQAGSDVTKAGYAFTDLDGDGREELIIAEESTDRTDNIWDLYTTLEDGTPIQLWVDEMDGGQCRLYEDNVISIAFSMKHELEQTFYKLEAGKLAVLESLQWEDEDTVFHTDSEGNTRQVTSREGQAIGYSYEHQKLTLNWFTGTPDYLRDTDAVERYTPVIEKYKTALLEGWTWDQCQANDISHQIMFNNVIKNDLGWCLMDLDHNGVQELIVSDGIHLYDLFTLMPTDGLPGHILCANSAAFTLCKDGTIEKRENSGTDTWWRWFEFTEDHLVEWQHLLLEGEKHRYSVGSSDQELQVITEEEAGSILIRDERSIMELTLTPFVEAEFPEIREPNFYYESLIETYRNAIQEDWDPGKCMEQGISLMIGYYGELYDNLGFNEIDLNGDGNGELVITDGNNIYDLYTVISDETVGAVRLVDATERKQFFLTTDGKLYEMGSGGAFVSYHSLYQMGQRDLILEKGYMMDAQADSKNPWFYYDGTDKGDPCPTQEAAQVMDNIHFAEIAFIPFT